MDSGSPSGAEKLGERLVREVEEEGLSELLASLRELQEDGSSRKRSHFGIPELDALLLQPAPTSTVQEQPQVPAPRISNSDDLWDPNQIPNPVQLPATVSTKKSEADSVPPHPHPILELISPATSHTPSGSGKTSLIYLIIALAILPTTISADPPIQLHGKNAAIVILDPLSHFSVTRLAEVCLSHILALTPELHKRTAYLAEIKTTVSTALHHVHIFQPTSWETMLATLQTLPGYLFDSTRHESTRRRISSIVLEDIDAFYWDIRASTSTSTTTTSTTTSTSPLKSASQNLTQVLLTLSTQFSTSILLSSHSSTTSPTSSRFVAPIPTSWPPHVSVTKLAVRRVEVLPFAPGISVEEAERERDRRWDVVKRGRFECWKVGLGREEKGKGKEGEGFVFRVGRGVEIEVEKDARGESSK